MSSTIATAAGPVRFQILSDLHLEIPMTLDRCPALQGFAPDPSASVLALLGDIGDPLPGEYRSASYRSFIYAQAEVFEYVLLLTGNHEYYHHHQEQVHDAIEQLCREAPRRNVVFLHKSSFDYRGVRFLGCTLWIPLDGAPQSGTSDYKVSRHMLATSTTSTSTACIVAHDMMNIRRRSNWPRAPRSHGRTPTHGTMINSSGWPSRLLQFEVRQTTCVKRSDVTDAQPASCSCSWDSQPCCRRRGNATLGRGTHPSCSDVPQHHESTVVHARSDRWLMYVVALRISCGGAFAPPDGPAPVCRQVPTRST